MSGRAGFISEEEIIGMSEEEEKIAMSGRASFISEEEKIELSEEEEVIIQLTGSASDTSEEAFATPVRNRRAENKLRIAEKYVKAIVEDVPLSSKHMPLSTTIPRFPIIFHQTDKSLFDPLMVPIGPYYTRDGGLSIQNNKLRLLKSFLDRNSKLCLEDCIKALMSLHPDAWQCYEDSKIELGYIPHNLLSLKKRMQENQPESLMGISLDDPEYFVLLLLLDGCFILELFYKWYYGQPDFLSTERRGQRLIFSDLLLFANQIPFVVIEKLHNLVMDDPERPRMDPESFRSLLALFLMNEEPCYTFKLTDWPNPIHHLLDLYHKFLITTTSLCQDDEENYHPTQLIDQWVGNRPPRQIPCATALHEVGIKFRKKQSPKNLLDVTFSRGILEIPLLQFDENKKILFSNLIALEGKKHWKERIVTSYIVLMDSLINTEADVELLQRAGVIYNMLPTHKDAAVFFNELGGSLVFDTVNHHFAKLFRKVQRYYDSSWNRSLARLFRDYCNSFWAILSVIAGLILLVLTTLQTFYTVYPYYRPH